MRGLPQGRENVKKEEIKTKNPHGIKKPARVGLFEIMKKSLTHFTSASHMYTLYSQVDFSTSRVKVKTGSYPGNETNVEKTGFLWHYLFNH